SLFPAVEKKKGKTNTPDNTPKGDGAAGTGSLIEQRAARLLFENKRVGEIPKKPPTASKIAGRCSVFAKSDMIHAQQKGATPPQILKGLCEAVARNCKASVIKSRKIKGPVVFTGGLSHNAAVAESLKKLAGLDLTPSSEPLDASAIGAALILAKSGGKPFDFSAPLDDGEQLFPSWPPLTMEKVRVIAPNKAVIPESGEIRGYLGVDIGSVSTNLVLVGEEGELIHEIYLRTLARPVEAVKKGLDEIETLFGERLKVLGVGTTGSGRELIGELLGADTVNDEITAHKTGAFEVAGRHFIASVDTIFEIGGQDSKYISLKDGVVVDFAMNEACAAGTGSFLDEQAQKLGVNIVGEFADLAFSAKTPTRLGERCTVYIEKDVSASLALGAAKNDVIAGLSYSVAQNYL
ncbi:hypothetical protein FDZ71_11505, partial [bacterium]